jgi:hypothetical protein
MARTKTKPENGNGSTLGFEAKLWLAADKLRNNLDAAEYKHVVLGLIFLKYTSDAFEEQHAMEIRCQKSRVRNPVSGNPVSVHHSCPKRCEKMNRHRITPATPDYARHRITPFRLAAFRHGHLVG